MFNARATRRSLSDTLVARFGPSSCRPIWFTLCSAFARRHHTHSGCALKAHIWQSVVPPAERYCPADPGSALRCGRVSHLVGISAQPDRWRSWSLAGIELWAAGAASCLRGGPALGIIVIPSRYRRWPGTAALLVAALRKWTDACVDARPGRGAICDYCAVMPPSITSSEPVIQDDSSDARNSTPLAMSWAVPSRPIGVRSSRI